MIAALQIAIGSLAGLALTYVHLRTLRPSVDWLIQGRMGAAVGLLLARFGLLGLALLAMVELGPRALVAALVTMVIGRAVLMKRMAGSAT